MSDTDPSRRWIKIYPAEELAEDEYHNLSLAESGMYFELRMLMTLRHDWRLPADRNTIASMLDANVMEPDPDWPEMPPWYAMIDTLIYKHLLVPHDGWIYSPRVIRRNKKRRKGQVFVFGKF